MRVFAATTAVAFGAIGFQAHAGILDLSRVTVVGTDAVTGYTTLELDVEGVFHKGLVGDPGNDVFMIPMGPDAEVVGLGIDVHYSTIGASVVSDARAVFENLPAALGDFGLDLNDHTSASNDARAVPVFYLGDFGFPGMSAGADGIYRLEFYEFAVDNGGTGDLVYEANSTYTLVVRNYVPAPGTGAAMLLAAVPMTRRRRAARG